MDLPADPLDEIENPMEPPIMPGMDTYADPLCRALDDLEHTIEAQQVLSSPVFDPMDEMLDNLERETEQQSNLPSISGQVSSTQDLVNSETGNHGLQGGVGGPKSTTPTPDLDETPIAKQYSIPIPRMRGHSGSSSRNTRDDSGSYCYLYETWVTDGCDESCQDFRQDEYTPEDEEKRCKHSIFRLSENIDG